MTRFHNDLRHFTEGTGIMVAILPNGFTVNGKEETPADVCAYKLDPDFKADPAAGYDISDKQYKTGCGRGWLVSMGRALYPFCAWCSKPIEQTTQQKEMENA